MNPFNTLPEKAVSPYKRSFFLILLVFYRISGFAQPHIQYISPESGPVGQTVTIVGDNFNPLPSANFVYFGAVQAPVLSASATTLTVTVPAGAGYQSIAVTTNALTAYSPKPFTVTFNDGANAFTDSSFANKITFPTAGQPNAVGAADFDGDGKIDIAEVGLLKSKLSVFQNTSTPGAVSLQPSLDFNTGASPYDIAIGDLNGDGKPDVVVTNDGSTTISYLQNTSSPGNINFSPKRDYPAISHPYSVTIADVDGDGRPDILVMNASPHILSIYRNIMLPTDTLAIFDVPVSVNTGNSPYFVRVADVDGDGKPDIVIPNWYASSISIFKNISTPGNIAMAASVDFQSGVYPSSITIADYDGDGLPDIAVTNFDPSTNTISVLRNASSSSGISLAPRVILPTGYMPNFANSADLNGDGKPDIMVSNGDNPGTVSVFKNISRPGSLSFSAQAFYGTGRGNMSGTIADLDGDYKPDLITPNYGDNTISVLRNTLHSADEPNIYSILPDSARSGDTVYIQGLHFTGTSDVRFGDQPTAGFQVVSDSVIMAVVGAGLTGNVAVTNAMGTGIFNRFVYVALPPVITSFSPDTAKPGDTVVLKGSNFTGATALRFGTDPACSFTVVNDSTVNAIVNQGASGSVYLSTSFGNNSLPGFIFVDTLKAPLILSATPLYGGPGNYTSITGRHFSKITDLRFGGVSAAAIVIYSDTLILAIIGNGASGAIYIANKIGADSLNGFVFIPPPAAPVITAFSPDSAATNGVVTIHGSHFNGTTNILFGGRAASAYTILSDTLITAVVNDGSSGAVTVINAIGTDSLNGFIYIAPAGPVINSFTPGSGWRDDVITIHGAHFTGATDVTIGGYVTIFTVVSDSVIQFIVGGGTTGDVMVATPYGTADMPGFLYEQAYTGPVINSFSPAAGGPGTIVTINGKKFTGLYEVDFGGAAAKSFTFLNDSTIEAVVANGASGSVTIRATAGTVDMPGFTYLATLDSSFVFNQFTAKPSGTNALLAWQTSEEQSILNYYIEFSTDSNSFQILDSQSAIRPGSGVSDYSYLDTHTADSAGYYRIGANDTLGNRIYSRWISWQTAAADTSSIKLYPNPAQNFLYIQYPPSSVSGVLKILDMKGVIMKTWPVQPNTSTMRITLEGINPGIYIITWSDDTRVLSNSLQIR